MVIAHFYPFSAIVGQDDLRLALILNAIDPTIGGVLIRGEKGTAKSTAARALSNLLPAIRVVAGCPYACAPEAPAIDCPHCHGQMNLIGLERPVRLINLPLGAGEDRVLGTLDLERALKTGERHFEPGLLAAAHRGILYIDEVNLLPDHLVDLLLDAAAMGRNLVEREGLSFSHASRFVLVGTMNPEEGELRPQLLDRFGLMITVGGLSDVAARAEVVRRRLAFERDPHAFHARFALFEAQLRDEIAAAGSRLENVVVPDQMLSLLTSICAETGVDGMRADIVLYKASVALAAYRCLSTVTEDEVRTAATFVLPHRRRRQPFGPVGLDQAQLDDIISRFNSLNSNSPGESPGGSSPPPVSSSGATSNMESDTLSGGDLTAGEGENHAGPAEIIEERAPDHANLPETGAQPSAARIEAPAPISARLPDLSPLLSTSRRTLAGSSRRGRSAAKGGNVAPVGVAPAVYVVKGDLAVAATLEAAAPYQKSRQAAENGGETMLKIERRDLRRNRRRGKISELHLFVVDASGSMGAQSRMSAVKGAIIGMLTDAYQKRDEVGLIVCHGTEAEILLPPTGSVERAERLLAILPTGGRTPLAHGLQLAADILRQEERHSPPRIPFLIVISDGRANVPLKGEEAFAATYSIASQLNEAGIRSIVLDSETGFVRFALAKKLAEALGAPCVGLDEFTAGRIQQTIKEIKREQF